MLFSIIEGKMNNTHVSARKSPNIKLQHERKLNGWSQEYIAEKVGTTAKNISRWERGDNKPVPYYREKLTQLFGKNAEELGFLDETTHVVTIQIQQQTPTRSDLQNANNDIIQYEEINHSATSEMPGQNAESGLEMNPGRRNVTKLIAAAATSSTLLPQLSLLNEDALERLSAIMKKPYNIDVRAINSLGLITKSHWELVYGGVPKRDLIFSAQGHFQSIIQFLQSSLLSAIEEQLYAIASQQAQIMNEIYFDMHDYQKASVYSKFAIESAQKAHNPALYAVALARMSFLYTYNHQFKEALPFLQVAHRSAEQTTDNTICCWIAAMEAEVQSNIFAHNNDIQALNNCLKALDRAEHISEQKGDDAFWTKFSPASLAGYKGVCYKQLQKPVEAQIVILDALSAITKDIPGGQATMLTDLAAAYAQQGEIHEACNRASQALSIINDQIKSVNTLQRVIDFRSSLEQWKSTPYVRNLDEQIAMTHVHII